MPFTRPSLTTIVARIEADMSTRLIGGKSVLRRSFLGVLARVFAGAIHMLYGATVWLSEQILPDTAEDEILERYADIHGVTRRAAAYATGEVDCTGTDGSTIPEGTLIQRSDGIQYSVDADATVAGGVATVDVTAVVAGADANADGGEAVSFVSPVSGVDQAATVDSTNGIAGGVDEESDAELRARLLAWIQMTPQGGSAADYEAWALEVSGVYRVFVFPEFDAENLIDDQPGYVGVTFITSDAAAPIPSTQLVTDVGDYVEERRPVTARVTVYKMTELSVSFEINLSPNTAAVQAAIKSELSALFAREGAPDDTIPLSHINEAISIATDEHDHELVLPVADITTTKIQYPVPDVDHIVFNTL
jgi:uncharacterized phage protein gp47/JayE